MTLRWGLIGCGDVAERKGGPALYSVSGSTLEAVMSRSLDKARDFAARHGTQRYYDSLKELFADDALNAIYIATPVYLHCEQAIAAAEAGKHILCEKPMAMNATQCQKMIDACRSNSVTLMIAYYRRFYPNIIKLKKLIDTGAIGQPLLARVENHSPLHLTPENKSHWKFNPKLSGGGVLMDIGSHRLDLLQYLFGEVAEINGRADRQFLSIDVDDSFTFEMKFKSGVRAIGSVCWHINRASDILEVYGSEGKLTIDGLNSGKLLLESTKGNHKYQLPALQCTHTGLVEDFLNHLRTGAPVNCSGAIGSKTNGLIEKIYQ